MVRPGLGRAPVWSLSRWIPRRDCPCPVPTTPTPARLPTEGPTGTWVTSSISRPAGSPGAIPTGARLPSHSRPTVACFSRTTRPARSFGSRPPLCDAFVMTPREAGFHMPAEWASHEATWLAWPSHLELWAEHLEPARAAVVRLARAVAAGERVEVLTLDATGEAQARSAIGSERVTFHRVPFGDIWLRDTAPLFLVDERGEVASVRFSFDGWGGKYVLEHDARVAERIAGLRSGARSFTMPFVLEGGAVEVDGEGTVLTTRQCLLRGQRNVAMSEHDIERKLCDSLGCEKVLWLENGLRNDHTDGHV